MANEFVLEMNVEIDADREILVNNRSADFDTLVYENFTIEWTPISFGAAEESQKQMVSKQEKLQEVNEEDVISNTDKKSDNFSPSQSISPSEVVSKSETGVETEILVYVNKEPVVLNGKSNYIFVDIFDFISFDLNAGNGRAIETLINGRKAQYTEPLLSGDKIELFWKEN